jgi:23S rRNA-intervening sequence protein
MDDTRFAMQKMDAYQIARELAHRVHLASIQDPELRDQAGRAIKSAFLGLCEGLPNEQVGLRRKYFTQANNSLHEVVGAVDLAAVLGAMRAEDARAIQALALRFKHMLRALLTGSTR